VLVRLRQEVQEVSRRLTPPDPPLADDLIRLEPLAQSHVSAFEVLVHDPDVRRFTLVPSDADEAFVVRWIGRYERGWDDGSCAGFALLVDEQVAGFAALVQLDLAAREGEVGYMVGPAARGRGAATRAVGLLTRWGFDDLALERLELRIDPSNTGSELVARRSGYTREGILRSKHFKEGSRAEVGIWSRLRGD
jgi:RimJ/RimL family protein N-acetyltransferase